MAWVATIALALPASSQSPHPTLTITLRTEQAVYKVGEPVVLDIVFSNPTTTPIQVWHSPGVQPGSQQGELYSTVDVTRSGERLQPTPHEQHAAAGGMPFVSRVLTSVQAGKDAKDGTTLNKLFDLSKPGQYTVQIHYKDDDDPAKASTSNLAAFEVKEP